MDVCAFGLGVVFVWMNRLRLETVKSPHGAADTKPFASRLPIEAKVAYVLRYVRTKKLAGLRVALASDNRARARLGS